MRQILDTVWQRRGVSWVWDEAALAEVALASEVISLRDLIQSQIDWPEDLPSKDGNSMVVSGLDAVLDLLTPQDAENWLGGKLKSAILSFQDAYSGEAALIFFLPGGHRRLTVDAATDAVRWRCSAPNGEQSLDFGRLLWGEAREYPQEILLAQGGKPVGLFHLRIT